MPDEVRGERWIKDGDDVEYKLYNRRFLILSIFCLYSMSSAFQWIEYSIVTGTAMEYWGVGELAIAWTSMIYMATFIPLMFVATWMLDNWGLRRILLFGASLNAAGSLIKLASLGRDRFYVSFIGQTVAACAQSFILEIPPKIASLWFGSSEVSTATSIGVFGNQLGVALGFLIPPLIVPSYVKVPEPDAAGTTQTPTVGNGTNATTAAPASTESGISTVPSMEEQHLMVEEGFRNLFILSACVCSFVVVMVFMVMRDEPSAPPSEARAVAMRMERESRAAAVDGGDGKNESSSYASSIWILAKDLPFMLLLVSYGINTGVYYAIGTLLQPLILPYMPGHEREIGQIGLTMVVAGLGGSVICGVFLDRTKKFKLTTMMIYVFTLVFMVVFALTIQFGSVALNFVTIGLLGFFMTGYLPIGFEFAAEITFPVSEATSSGLLNVSAQIFGIVFTLAVTVLVGYSVTWANVFMTATLAAGCLMTACIKTQLKRQHANTLGEKTAMNTNNSSSKLLPSKPAASGATARKEEKQPLGGSSDDVMRLASTSSCYSAGANW